MTGFFALPNWPLRAKLALLLVVACLLPLCFSEYLNIRQMRAKLVEAKQAQLVARAEQIVSEFDSINKGYLRAAQRVARFPDVASFCAPGGGVTQGVAERIRATLATFPLSDPGIQGAGLLDASGRIVIATDAPLVGLDLSRRVSVRSAMAGNTVISGIYLSSLAQHRPRVAYLAPVRDAAGMVVCTVGIWVAAEVFWDEMRSHHNLAGMGSYSVLFDATGVRIGHTASAEAVFHPAGPIDPATVDLLASENRFGGRTRELMNDILPSPEQFERARAKAPDTAPFLAISSYNKTSNHGVARRFNTIDWTVFYMLPEAELLGQIAQATRDRVMFDIGILAIAALLGLLFAGRIERSVRLLTTATAALAEGKPGVRLPALGNDEFGQLGKSFNTMAARIEQQAGQLRASNDDLERRVALRTRESDETAARLAAEMREHKAAQEREAGHQRLLQAVMDNSAAVIYVKDLDGRFMLVNNRFCELFHVEAGKVTGKTDHDIFSSEVADATVAMDHQVLQGGEPLVREESVAQHDGIHTYISVRCPLRGPDGTVQGIVAISTDITARKQAESSQLAHLERLRQLDQITIAIGERQDLQSIYQVAIGSVEEGMGLDFSCICAIEGGSGMLRVVHLGARSHTLLQVLNMSENSLVPVDANGLSRCMRGELVYEPDIEGLAFPFPQRLARGGLRSLVLAPLSFEGEVFGVLVAARRARGSFSSADCEFLRQLSGHVALAAHQAKLYDSLRGAYEDLRQTQDSALQQERLSALGQMASGIAHDINNAISPVALYTETLLEREPGLSPRTRSYLEIISRSIDDVAATVSRMREFSRQRESEVKLAPLSLNELAGHVIELTRARWSDMAQRQAVVIELKTELAADLPRVKGIESEVREALINLVFNAVDAMPQGGTITLRTRLIPRDAAAPGGRDHVAIEVADTGVGMTEEVRQRCFEPFFTTKGERGTGLGMAMVYGVMQRADARVTVDSTPGMGTSVQLVFPVPSIELAAAATPPSQELPPPQRLLVVDDDPALLRSLCESLRADGHEVTPAGGGNAGIDAFRDRAGTALAFDAVFTDLGMPRVGGREVADAIREMAPHVRIILLTGWGQRMADNSDAPSSVDIVLSKPARIRELRAALLQPLKRP